MVNHIKDHLAYFTRHNFLLARQMAKITQLEKFENGEHIRGKLPYERLGHIGGDELEW